MSRRHRDWIAQAEHDLKHAISSIELEDYEWACFAAHQAAEKALKALIISLGGKAIGHSIVSLMEAIDVDEKKLLKSGARLDKLYILTRYPNGFARGKPRDYYYQDDANQALHDAETLIAYCNDRLMEID